MKMLATKRAIVIMICGLVLLLGARSASAQLDLWGDPLAGQAVGFEAFGALGLGNRDPRVIVAAIVQIALGFLGVLAVLLILYAGWLWMTANGDQSKIDKAKSLMTNAVIGLAIILSAFAITTFILRALIRSTVGPENSSSNNLSNSCSPNGASLACGCGGTKICTDGSWSECIGSDCSQANRGRRFCDANPLTRPMCEAKDDLCGQEQFCNVTDCRCSPKAGYGEACDSSGDLPNCQADDNRCGVGLKCEVDRGCVCVGEPIIQSLSPSGGFCQGDINKVCANDADCAGLTPNKCDQATPNAAVGNLMTINGLYFLPYDPSSSKVYFSDGSNPTIEARLATTANINCKQDQAWTDKQIIVVVPAGAKPGPIKVVAANGSDQTDNNSGYKGQVVINTLIRPGLCQIDPVSGKFDTSVNYYGANLAASDAYFGSLMAGVKADGQSFANNDTGFASVPNIQAGLTSTFVRKLNTGLTSNYLQFKKEADEEMDPVVVGFEPLSASEGAYVTIRGRAFGLGREFESTVYFGEVEADFAFPPECASSIWNSSQIVVKVPKGLNNQVTYDLKVKVGDKEVVATEKFVYNKDLPLAPSLCKVEPIFAQPNETISLWGEYFESNNQFSKVRFYYNQDQSGEALDQWRFGAANKADFIKTTIPANSLTGPVYVVKKNPELVGNGLNLNIGQCVRDEQCGNSQVCCPQGTVAAGKCKVSAEECYGSNDTCVFEWDFSTGTDNGCPLNAPNLCDDSRCCKTKCQDNGNGQTVCGDQDGAGREACSGFGNALCLDSVLCPNSPGNCSFRAGVETKGLTCDCSLLGFAGTIYDAETNRCIDANQKCSAPKRMPDGAGQEVEAYCARYLDYGPRWHLRSKQTCPAGFTKVLGQPGLCVNTASDAEPCQLCADGLNCTEAGVCASPRSICPNNFQCQGAVNNVGGTCVRSAGTCECCCDKRQNDPVTKANPACCSELTCGNTCGAGSGSGGQDYGICSGCAAVGTTQAEHDNACNCVGTSGKFCDMTNAQQTGGICRDCGAIGDPTECSRHDACCVDMKNGGACSAVVGGARIAGEGQEANLNFCAYFDCASDCSPQKLGSYTAAEACMDACNGGGGDKINCDANPETATCDKDNDLCRTKLGNLQAFCNDQCLCELPDKDEAAKIKVEDYGPEGEQICRNPLIWINFDREMNLDSFNNNALLVGDYGQAACPQGTVLLAVNNRDGQPEVWYGRWWNKFNGLLKLIVKDAAAAEDKNNYCLVQTRTRAIETQLDGVKKSRILLEAKTALSPDTKYYVVIRGDEFLNGSTGIKDVKGVAFKGENKTEPLVNEFNGLAYVNAQIWQFTTGQELCTIDRVEIDPPQALFAEPNQLATLLARALSKDGQPLISTSLYSFQWSSWLVENPDLARLEVADLTDGQGLEPLAKAIAGSKMDGRTVARATVRVDYDGLSTVSTAGETRAGNAQLIFFYCANPWPARGSQASAWPIGWWDQTEKNPTAKCDVGDNACLSNDFQIYYCRDQAQVGTKDDLPALASDPVVRASYFYGTGSQTTEVLKDIYFFRELKPVAPSAMQISNDLNSQLGSAVIVKFPARNLFKRYKIYYGEVSGVYTNYVEVQRDDQADELTARIGGLVNGRQYYFSVTSIGGGNVESAFGAEQEFTVRDEVPPVARDNQVGQAPLVNSVTINVNDRDNKKINIAWAKEQIDVAGYNLNYGPNVVPAVKIKLGLINNYTISGLNNLDNQDYYLQLSAFDKAGNQGAWVNYQCAKGCAGICECQEIKN